MLKWILILLVCVIAPPQLAWAHHSSSPHYDANKPVSIVGEVVEFKFVNPHAFLYLNVANEDGSVSLWNCEFQAASKHRRDGWTKDIFEPGSTVRIQGMSARRDPNGCSFQSGVLEDGTRLTRNSVIESRATTQVSAIPGDSIAGNWQSIPRQRRPGQDRGNQGRGRAATLLTEEHKAALENYDQRFDDPALQCSPSSIIRVWGEPNAVNAIEVGEETVVIRHEFMDTMRTVRLGTSKPPDGYEPGLTGYSIGYFEGDDLIIETTGFKAGVLMPHPGMLHSDEMKITERLSMNDDGSELVREYTVTDPHYLKEPYTGRSGWRRTDLSLSSYDCVELGGVSNDRSAGD